MDQSFIQHMDFSTEDITVADYASAQVAVEKFSWAEESKKIEQALRQNDDFCPPGISLSRGDNQLHIFMSEPNKYSVLLTIPTKPAKKTFFSFLSSHAPQPISYENLAWPQIKKLLELFYQDNFEQLKNFA
ncbi:MAG: hypothetical protein WCW27_01195 [Patescibacteria group bacterium]|jgi:hypothetical protein